MVGSEKPLKFPENPGIDVHVSTTVWGIAGGR